MNLDERARWLHDQGVHSVLATFTDVHGVLKGKLVPLAGLADAVAIGAGFAGPSIWGTGLPRHGPRSEYFGRVLPETLRPLPFMPGVAHAVCDGFAGGAPLDTCSRQVLKRQTERLRERAPLAAARELATIDGVVVVDARALLPDSTLLHGGTCHPYDLAAPVLILDEAGGSVRGMSGAPFDQPLDAVHAAGFLAFTNRATAARALPGGGAPEGESGVLGVVHGVLGVCYPGY